MASPLATTWQRDAERRSLALIEHPEVRAAREAARAQLLADPVAQRMDGRLGLDRALDQWMMALVMRIQNADPYRPVPVWNIFNPARHWFGHIYPGAAVAIDNPDNSNREICIDGDALYRIEGQFSARPGQYMIEVVTDFIGYAGVGRTLGALTSQQIVADPNGRFVIEVGRGAGGPNVLPSEPGPLWVFCRDSLSDWRQTPVTLSVSRVSAASAPPPRTEAAMVADIVANVPGWITFWRTFKDDFLGPPPPNTLANPIGRPGGWGFLTGGQFKLSGDDAVVVTTSDGGANYTGFQISDPWTLSPDPVLRLASLNRAQVKVGPGGLTTYVVSQRDPGVHNWIDTCGLSEGWMLLRWQGVPKSTEPTSLVRSVKATTVAELDLPRIDLAGRSAQILERIETFETRIATQG